MKAIILFLISWVFVYLIFAFISLELDFRNWDAFIGRTFYVLISLTISIMAFNKFG